MGTATTAYDIVYSHNTDTPVIIDNTTGERMPAIFFFNRTSFVVNIFDLNDKETVIKNIGQKIDGDFE